MTASSYLSMRAIRDRGWSLSMIQDLLGEPDDYAPNPRYRNASPCKLYARNRVQAVETSAEYAGRVAALLKRRVGKDYTPIFARRYGARSAAILDAAQGMFNINRYAKLATCSVKHQSEIYALKNKFLTWLFTGGHLSAWGHHEILKPEKVLACYCVLHHGEDGCPRCDYTGVHRTLPPLVLKYVVLRFVIEGKTYTWHQPAESVRFHYQCGSQIIPTGDWMPEAEKPVEMPRRKFAEAKALVRWILEEPARPSMADTLQFNETGRRYDEFHVRPKLRHIGDVHVEN